MEKPFKNFLNSYCEYASKLDKSNPHRIYHDTQYGFPVKNDNELFGRLVLEINQAGLSWTTILKKQNNFKKAYGNFNIQKVSKYNEKDIERLLADSGIIRNKLKINAAIYNAQKINLIQHEFGSFKKWLDTHQEKKIESWVKLFKSVFKFTGFEITNEFLISTGYLKGAHSRSCSMFSKLD